jgi:hypothetical protein
MTRALVIGLVLSTALAALVVATPAEASNLRYDGYICTLLSSPESTSQRGSYGFVQIGLYSQGGCSGNFIGAFYLNSTNATEGGAKWREAALYNNLQVLRNAQISWNKTSVYAESTNKAVYSLGYSIE